MQIRPLKALTLVSALCLLAPVAAEAQYGNPTESFGTYKDPTTRAAECYGRGARAMKKAKKQEAAGETEKARESYRRAKEEFSEAVGIQQGYFDALLGLGQAHLALGQKESALDACTFALAVKPKNPDAQACIEAAHAPAAAG